MFQFGQVKSCSCNFSFPRRSTYFRFVMQAGDLSHGKESAGELQGGTHMHHSCPLVMSQVFLLPFRFRVRRSSLTFVRQLAICKCKEREGKENGTRLRNRNATETVSQSALNTSTSVADGRD